MEPSLNSLSRSNLLLQAVLTPCSYFSVALSVYVFIKSMFVSQLDDNLCYGRIYVFLFPSVYLAPVSRGAYTYLLYVWLTDQ